MFLLSRAIKLLWRRDRADDDVEAAEEAHVAVKSGYQHVDGELSEDNEGYATAKSETRDGEAVEIVTVLWHDERGDVEVTAIALSDLEQPNVEESPAAPSANDNLRTAHSGPPSRRSDGRPAAEPPMFNYERFERECIPSDKMLKKAFPGNPAKATAYRDVLTERELLEIYRDWAYDMWSSSYEKGWTRVTFTLVYNELWTLIIRMSAKSAKSSQINWQT